MNFFSQRILIYIKKKSIFGVGGVVAGWRGQGGGGRGGRNGYTDKHAQTNLPLLGGGVGGGLHHHQLIIKG